MGFLIGKRFLVSGILSNRSIAYGIAPIFGVVETPEILAEMLHPDLFEPRHRDAAWRIWAQTSEMGYGLAVSTHPGGPS